MQTVAPHAGRPRKATEVFSPGCFRTANARSHSNGSSRAVPWDMHLLFSECPPPMAELHGFHREASHDGMTLFFFLLRRTVSKL